MPDDIEAIRWALAEALADNVRYRRALWGVVRTAKNIGAKVDLYARPVWATVMDLTTLGSTSAYRLCREFGVDPDEMTDPPPRDENDPDEDEEDEDNA